MNLLSKLHKNSILTGPVESYCLACSFLLKSEEESYAHINNPGHSAKREALQILDSYKNDQIIVIKNKEGYYCPYCNIILPTVKRVSLHVTEEKHQEIKESQAISRKHGVILAYNSLLISEKAWNGLDGVTCFVCNEDYLNEDHIIDKGHVLKLIQSKCEFGETYVYRKVDDDFFFCLICGDFHENEEKPTHHDTETHLQHYNSSKQLAVDLQNNTIDDVPELNNNIIKNNTPLNEEKLSTQVSEQNKDANDNKPKHNGDKIDTAIDNTKHKTETPQEKAVNTNSHDSPKLNDENDKIPSATPKLGAENAKVSQSLQVTKLSPQTTNLPNGNANNAKGAQLNIQNEQNITDRSTVNAKTDCDKVSKHNKQETGVYKFLKSQNFVAVSMIGNSYCTLCDCSIQTSIDEHSEDAHHRILFAKHMARKDVENVIVQPNENNNAKPQEEIFKNVKVENVSSKNISKAPITDKGTNTAQNKICAAEKTNETIHLTEETQTQTSVIKQENNKIENKTHVIVQLDKTTAPITKPNENVNDKEAKAIVTAQPSNKTKTKALFEQNNNSENIAIKNTIEEKENIPNNIEKGKNNVMHAKDEKSNQKEGKNASKKNKKKAKLALIAKEDLTQENTAPAFETEPHNNKLSAENEKNSKRNICETNNGESNDLEDKTKERNTEIQLQNFTNFLKTVSQFDNVPDDLVVNGEFVLGNLSFMLIVHEGTKYTCLACEGFMTQDQVYKHVSTEQHKDNVEASQVVTSLDDEFIRLLKTEKYHCGFCNIVTEDWTDMQSHLESFRHDDAKTSACWRLERYHPHLRHCTTREVRSILCSISRVTRE